VQAAPVKKAAPSANGKPQTKSQAPVPIDPDEAVYARIAQYRKVAEQIQVDGDSKDWAEMPTVKGAQFPLKPGKVVDEGPAEPRLRIKRAGIAVRDYDLLVMVQTVQPPTQEDWAFLVLVSLGTEYSDFRINFAFDQPHTLDVLKHSDGAIETQYRIPLSELQVAVGDCVEARIPFDTLARYLPPEMMTALADADIRPWIRVTPFTLNVKTSKYVDAGPAVAGYRLITKRYSLDPPSPSASVPAIPILLPVAGRWFVYEAPYTGTHKGRWAYDLQICDERGLNASTINPERNEDYWTWEQPVYAPITSWIVSAERRNPDHPPGTIDWSLLNQANSITLDIGHDVWLTLGHFRQDSISPDVTAGAAVAKGTLLGSIGDSGTSKFPHMHLELSSGLSRSTIVPFTFKRVRVSLNPQPDPWSRDLKIWRPTVGYFVESLEPWR